MKNVLLMLTLGLLGVFYACNPIEDRNTLGDVPTPDQIDVSVTSIDGTNKIVLKNNTPQYGGMWDYKFGTSTKMIDTVIVPVVGTYAVTYKATTAGAIVDKDVLTKRITLLK